MIDIVIAGPPKSGKTSIKKVVFEKMSPHESVFNAKTEDFDSFHVKSLNYCKLGMITEIPSNYSIDKPSPEEEKFLKNCGTLIYVVDIEDTSGIGIDYFKSSIFPLLKKYPKISDLAVLIHKADDMNEGTNDFDKLKGELQGKINQLVSNPQNDKKGVNTNYFFTSIYNSSLFETFSKILRKFIPQNKNLENLLNNLVINSHFENAYLFDVFNKIFLAVDDSAGGENSYEVCADVIDVALDMSGIYGDESNTDSYFDDNSTCLIKYENIAQNNNSKGILCLKFIDSNLALVAITKDEYFEKTHLLEYNVQIFRETVKKVLNKH